jgi:ubiquinone/menaquinone biosynthesis C-methylase UbiE
MDIKLLKIDFGGGLTKRYEDSGFDICDLLKDKGIKYGGVDFEKDKLPFLNNSIDEAICRHCLEHVINTRHFLNELHRVLKKDAYITFTVPYGLWEGSFKPVHYNQITECWFDFLRNKGSENVYGYKLWEIKSMELCKNNQGQIYEIICIMKPEK